MLIAGCSEVARDAASLDRARHFAAADHGCPLDRVRPMRALPDGVVHGFAGERVVEYFGLVGVVQRRIASTWSLDVCGRPRVYQRGPWSYRFVERPLAHSDGWIQSICCVGRWPTLGLDTPDDID
jgi:hypothetical protein